MYQVQMRDGYGRTIECRGCYSEEMAESEYVDMAVRYGNGKYPKGKVLVLDARGRETGMYLT